MISASPVTAMPRSCAFNSHPEVCLSYASLDAADFVSVAGPATLVTENASR